MQYPEHLLMFEQMTSYLEASGFSLANCYIVSITWTVVRCSNTCADVEWVLISGAYYITKSFFRGKRGSMCGAPMCWTCNV